MMPDKIEKIIFQDEPARDDIKGPVMMIVRVKH